MQGRIEDHEIGGPDPLDAAPPPPVRGWLGRLGRRLRTSVALGVPPILAPALLFIPLGALLGPLGANLLNAAVVRHLGPAISMALATLGIFVGLALSRRAGRRSRLLLAASVESGVTVAVVAATTGLLLWAWQYPGQAAGAILALILGVCAAASSAGYEDTGPGTLPSIAARIADLDDVVPIVVGGATLAALQAEGVRHFLMLTALTVAVGGAVGVIGTLLIERARSEAERSLFVIGTLALAGGAPAYLGLSPLLVGLTAGIVWNWGPGRTDTIVRRDMRRYQHPLVVLLLLSAGAGLTLTPHALWLFAPFVLFRMTGKIAGGWLASRFTPTLAPGELGAHLLAPGLMGIAFALNAAQVLRLPDSGAVLTAVVAGTLVSELIALIMAPAQAQLGHELPPKAA